MSSRFERSGGPTLTTGDTIPCAGSWDWIKRNKGEGGWEHTLSLSATVGHLLLKPRARRSFSRKLLFVRRWITALRKMTIQGVSKLCCRIPYSRGKTWGALGLHGHIWLPWKPNADKPRRFGKTVGLPESLKGGNPLCNQPVTFLLRKAVRTLFPSPISPDVGISCLP